MALAASGVLSTIAGRAKKTLGQCTSWQAWTGHSADEISATLHIAEFERKWADSDVGPGDVRAMLRPEHAQPVRNTGIWQAEIVFHFEAPVGAEYLADSEQAFREFQNHLGAVIDELRADSLVDTTGLLLALRSDEGAIDGPYLAVEQQAAVDVPIVWADYRVPAGPKG